LSESNPVDVLDRSLFSRSLLHLLLISAISLALPMSPVISTIYGDYLPRNCSSLHPTTFTCLDRFRILQPIQLPSLRISHQMIPFVDGHVMWFSSNHKLNAFGERRDMWYGAVSWQILTRDRGNVNWDLDRDMWSERKSAIMVLFGRSCQTIVGSSHQ
jgi:hypothetical protein